MKSTDARVELREIDDGNRALVEALAVTPAQSHFVAGVSQSLKEAAATPDACPWFRAVYDDQTPVGFVMLSDNIPPERTEYIGPYFIWRLLIDTRFQGRGHGRAAIDLCAEYVRTRPGAEVLLTSCGLGKGSPLPFYLNYGFTTEGEMHDNELVLSLRL
jgi:diamine N-acetyltransferase